MLSFFLDKITYYYFKTTYYLYFFMKKSQFLNTNLQIPDKSPSSFSCRPASGSSSEFSSTFCTRPPESSPPAARRSEKEKRRCICSLPRWPTLMTSTAVTSQTFLEFQYQTDRVPEEKFFKVKPITFVREFKFYSLSCD